MIASAGVHRGERFQPLLEEFVRRSAGGNALEGSINGVMKALPLTTTAP